LSLLVLSPVLILSLLELGLRAGGYGYSPRFFIKGETQDSFRTNDRFGCRFFPASLTRPAEPCVLSPKSARSIRIFILGSSAAEGIPDASFAFGRILEVMLRKNYPDVSFEVVNAAMTAINSHVVLEIARDCAAQEPDLFIVYTGNNEVVGPYGPGTVFQKGSPSLATIRVSIWAKSMRIGQWVSDVFGRLHRDDETPTQWRGMQMFMKNPVTADDGRLRSVYDNLRQNLMDICSVARQAGAPVVLSTMATNLRDCPPLASKHRADLSSSDLRKWEAAYREGIEREAAGKRPEAIQKYEEASRIDDRFAELHYRLARCLAAEEKWPEAHEQFVVARDLDALRFRADSRINDVIREVAADRQAAGVRFVDAERALAESDLAPGDRLGGALFYEHVHLTFDGNYQLARAMLDPVVAALPRLGGDRTGRPVPSRQQCAASLALTPRDELQMAGSMAEMTSRAPFTDQLDHSIRQAATRERISRLEQSALKPESLQTALKTCESALAQTPDDWRLREKYGELALQIGRPDVAARQWQTVVEKLPRETWLLNKHGTAWARMGKFTEAMAQYEQALKTKRNDAETHENLGNVLAQVGRVSEAVEHYETVLRRNPDKVEVQNNLGNALCSLGRASEAIRHYEQALRIDPDFADAHYNLGMVLQQTGKLLAAIQHYRQALRIRPDYREAYHNLNLILRQMDTVP
jgi:tetratricopeptide (TPR) repeat protein